ncbi:MAG: monovalent cation/H+ antiporter complex subunit F [Alphaproteobacteria bacterium]
MSILLVAATISGIFVGIGLIGAIWRVLRGPSTIDRIIAIDTLGQVGIAAAALAAVFAGHRGFLDVAFGIAIVAFLAAVAFAGLLERTSGSDGPADSKGASS